MVLVYLFYQDRRVETAKVGKIRIMSIIIAMKFIHYLALFLAGGLGVANGLLAKAHQRVDQSPALPVQQTMVTLARIGLIAVVLLWVTGFGLTHLVYNGFAVGWAFHMKLFGASILLGTISFLNIHLTLRGKAGLPPHPSVMKIIPTVSRGALVLVLLGIAITTTG